MKLTDISKKATLSGKKILSGILVGGLLLCAPAVLSGCGSKDTTTESANNTSTEDSIIGRVDETNKDNPEVLSPHFAKASASDADDGGESDGSAEKTTIKGVREIALFHLSDTSGVKEKITKYESPWVKGQDIVTIDAFATDDDSVPISVGTGNVFKETWLGYWQSFEGYEDCKVGYNVSFKLKNGEVINQTILKPSDVFSYRPYMENYLYDDLANANSGWYSHLLDEEVTDDTVMDCVKFTAGEQYEEIDGNVTLTVFVYNSDKDFDSKGNYIGDVSYSVEIINTQ